MILLQIGRPNAENGELLYRAERVVIGNVMMVIKTEWDENGIETVSSRPATDYEASLVQEPDCPLVVPD
jgi:hypothetical protein